MKVSSCLFPLSLHGKWAALLFLFGMAVPGLCQTPQQHVYATGTSTTASNAAAVSGFTKDSASGSLTTITPTPFSAPFEGPMAVDGQGKFLFVAGPTSIAMYAIDQTSGALTEVQRSPLSLIHI